MKLCNKGSINTRTLLAITGCLGLLTSAPFASADPGPATGASDPISLDRQSPSVFTFGSSPGNIYGDNPPVLGGYDVAGPGPVLHVQDNSYGLGPADNNDGHSNGEVDPTAAPVIYFSADDSSMGAAGTEYRQQAVRTQAAGDRFVTNGETNLSPAAVMSGTGPATIAGPVIPGRSSINLLSINQDWYNEVPSIGPAAINTYAPNPGETAMDDMDALELTEMDLNGDFIHDTNIYFSLDAISPGLNGASAADILLSTVGTPGFGVFASSSTLGLVAGDEVDALAVWDLSNTDILDIGSDYALFSLAPNSPFLAGVDGIFGTTDDFSAADIFVTDFTNTNALFLTAGSIGLLFTDNLNALDVEIGGGGIPQVFEAAVVPVPAAVWLFGSGLLGLIGITKRKQK